MLPLIDYSSLLGCLTRESLVEVGRSLVVSFPLSARTDKQIENFLGSAPPRPWPLVGLLQRSGLKVIRRQHGLPDGGRTRRELARWVLVATGELDVSPASVFASYTQIRESPLPGDVVRVRHRQSLVETVTPPTRACRPGSIAAHRALASLTATARADRSKSFGEVEQGARIQPSHERTMSEPAALDAPRTFGAYLATLRWHGVTATDARLFQALFRAGIQFFNHSGAARAAARQPLHRRRRQPRRTHRGRG